MAAWRTEGWHRGRCGDWRAEQLLGFSSFDIDTVMNTWYLEEVTAIIILSSLKHLSRPGGDNLFKCLFSLYKCLEIFLQCKSSKRLFWQGEDDYHEYCVVLISNLGTLAITPSGSSDSRHGGSVLVNVNLFSNEICLSASDEKREVLIKMQLNFQSFRSQFN